MFGFLLWTSDNDGQAVSLSIIYLFLDLRLSTLESNAGGWRWSEGGDGARLETEQGRRLGEGKEWRLSARAETGRRHGTQFPRSESGLGD